MKYEKTVVTPGSPAKVIPNPHAPNGLGHWKSKAGRAEDYYYIRNDVVSLRVMLECYCMFGL